MARVLDRPATYEDLLQVPDHMVAEIVHGELIVSPRPAPRHARAAGEIFRRIANAFDDGDGGPGGWWIVFEPELHLGRDVLVPDIAGWRRERMPVFPDAAAFDLVPDWVCEVLSTSTARLDRFRKMPAYERHGVRHVWLVDPIARGVEVYRLDTAHYSLIARFDGDEPARIEPFDAIELPLSYLWLKE